MLVVFTCVLQKHLSLQDCSNSAVKQLQPVGMVDLMATESLISPCVSDGGGEE